MIYAAIQRRVYVIIFACDQFQFNLQRQSYILSTFSVAPNLYDQRNLLLLSPCVSRFKFYDSVQFVAYYLHQYNCPFPNRCNFWLNRRLDTPLNNFARGKSTYKKGAFANINFLISTQTSLLMDKVTVNNAVANASDKRLKQPLPLVI